MRAVVTGGAAFLGSHLCDRLIAEGWDVLALDNLITGVDSNVGHLLKFPRFRIARADVSMYIDVPGPVDYVLHFASPASPVDYLKLPIQTLKVGALGTHNALGLALQPLPVYGDGQQTRSFCYVSDLVEGIYRLMQSGEHLPVNIGNPQEITILEFAGRIRAHFPDAPPIVFKPLPQDDPKRRCPDISKAKRLLNWEPKVGLEEGLGLTLDYFKKQYAAAAK